MKRIAVFFAVVIAGLTAVFAADPISVVTPEGYDTTGKAKLARLSNVENRAECLYFNGSNSIMVLMYPEALKTLTVWADFTLPALPADSGMLFARPGFHNGVMVNRNGTLMLTFYGADKKTTRMITASEKLIPGERYKVAAVMDQGPDKTMISLYLNGSLVGRSMLRGEAYPYGQFLVIGAGNVSSLPLEAELHKLMVFDTALSADEIAALK